MTPSPLSEPRNRMPTVGRIVHQDGVKSLDCMILDASEESASVRIGANRTLPASVFLINVREHTAHEAEVVWRKPDSAGLKLVRAHLLGGTIPKELAFLRRHWLECATR